MEEQVFWFVATLSCVLAFGFAVKHKGAVAASPRPVHVGLAKGQEKDNWLTCAIVWLVVFSEHWNGREAILVLGATGLLWTAWRTYRRVLLLRR